MKINVQLTEGELLHLQSVLRLKIQKCEENMRAMAEINADSAGYWLEEINETLALGNKLEAARKAAFDKYLCKEYGGREHE